MASSFVDASGFVFSPLGAALLSYPAAWITVWLYRRAVGRHMRERASRDDGGTTAPQAPRTPVGPRPRPALRVELASEGEVDAAADPAVLRFALGAPWRAAAAYAAAGLAPATSVAAIQMAAGFPCTTATVHQETLPRSTRGPASRARREDRPVLGEHGAAVGKNLGGEDELAVVFLPSPDAAPAGPLRAAVREAGRPGLSPLASCSKGVSAHWMGSAILGRPLSHLPT